MQDEADGSVCAVVNKLKKLAACSMKICKVACDTLPLRKALKQSDVK